MAVWHKNGRCSSDFILLILICFVSCRLHFFLHRNIDGMTDCSDSECCSHPICAEHIMCLASNDPVEVLLRKQPPSVTASFYQRVKFLIEENSVQSYAHMDEYSERWVISDFHVPFRKSCCCLWFDSKFFWVSFFWFSFFLYWFYVFFFFSLPFHIWKMKLKETHNLIKWIGKPTTFYCCFWVCELILEF